MDYTYEEIIDNMEDDIYLYIDNIYADFKNEFMNIFDSAKLDGLKYITFNCSILDYISKKIYNQNLDENFAIFFRKNNIKDSVLFNEHIKPLILNELLYELKNNLKYKIYIIYRDLEPEPIATITWTYSKYIKYILLHKLLGVNTPDDSKHMTTKIRLALFMLFLVIILKIVLVFYK
ncbi:hypothetical protein [Clostridium baratii]|uniref:hypothetical protein n=1 Tax=Clostridium baratii TaxID=1561 RepID=UPI0005F2EDA5|nr:hypothetical protein [Clostridium baratii]KJU71535.1 hypothetical protein UC77_08960 [Clostridium baratii]